jgi:hypothetical protein
MVQQSIDVLQNFRDEMRPWVYQLVQVCLERAERVNDEVAMQAFLYICNHNVLWSQSDIEQFTNIRDRLDNSPHKEVYIETICHMFKTVYGDIEGF